MNKKATRILTSRAGNNNIATAKSQDFGALKTRKVFMESKRSQEEIVGFIMIILLVVIIGVVFLAISLRKPAAALQSSEVASFLQAARQVSSDCYIIAERKETIGDLFEDCASNRLCMNDKTGCEMLDYTLRLVLDEGLNPGTSNPINYYSFKAYNKDINQTVIYLERGNCTGTRSTDFIIIPTSYAGTIRADLEICGG